MLVSRKRRLPTATAATGSAGSAAKRALRCSVVLLVFSENRWLPSSGHQQRSKYLPITAKPCSDVSQIRPRFVLAAQGAYVGEADTTQAVVAQRPPFVDDGMFDPRQDYWDTVSRAGGMDSTATTPASSNWGAGKIQGQIMFPYEANAVRRRCVFVPLPCCTLVCSVCRLYGTSELFSRRQPQASSLRILYVKLAQIPVPYIRIV